MSVLFYAPSPLGWVVLGDAGAHGRYVRQHAFVTIMFGYIEHGNFRSHLESVAFRFIFLCLLMVQVRQQ